MAMTKDFNKLKAELPKGSQVCLPDPYRGGRLHQATIIGHNKRYCLAVAQFNDSKQKIEVGVGES